MSDDKDELDLHVAPHLREIRGKMIPSNTRPVLCRKCYVKMIDKEFGNECPKCGLQNRWKTKLAF